MDDALGSAGIIRVRTKESESSLENVIGFPSKHRVSGEDLSLMSP